MSYNPTAARVAISQTFTKTQTITPTSGIGLTINPVATADGLKIIVPSYASSSAGAGLHLIDNANGSNAGPLLSVDNFGQFNGVDVKQFPGAVAGAAFAIHCYARMAAGQAAFVLDNTDSGTGIKLKNTEGSNNPNGWGSGNYFDLYGYEGATANTADGTITSGQAVLTSTSGTFQASDVGKPIRVPGAGVAGANLDTTILSYQSATQVTLATNASTSVTTSAYLLPRVANVQRLAHITGTPPGFGSRVGALRFINDQTGQHNVNATPWSFENASDNGASALQVQQAAGTSGATALLVNNLGNTGLLLALQSAGNNKFLIDNNGSVTRMGNLTMTGTGTDGNMIFGTTTGTRIGTATTQKLSFYNATPVVQPSGTPAASTDLASVISLANSLRTSLIALGLVA